MDPTVRIFYQWRRSLQTSLLEKPYLIGREYFVADRYTRLGTDLLAIPRHRSE